MYDYSSTVHRGWCFSDIHYITKYTFCYDSLRMMTISCIKYILSPHRMMCFWQPPTTTRPTRRRPRSSPVRCCSHSVWWMSWGCRGRSCWSRVTPPWGRGRVVPTAPTTPQVGVDMVKGVYSLLHVYYQSVIYVLYLGLFIKVQHLTLHK